MKRTMHFLVVFSMLLMLWGCGSALTPSRHPVGYFAVSSVSTDGNLVFYGNIDPENGWLRIRADGTGAMYYDGVTWEFTADSQYLQTGEDAIPYVYTATDTEAMLAVYIMNDQVDSIIFRPIEETTP